MIGIISVALIVCSVYYEPFMMQSAQSHTPDSSIFTLSFVEDVEAEPETVNTKTDELTPLSAIKAINLNQRHILVLGNLFNIPLPYLADYR